MFRVAIVGAHGSGKTTFLGLVYAAMVSSGSGRDDDLRFHVAYESMEEISGLFQRIMSGGFPDSATKEGLHELRLELDASRTGHGLLGRLGSGKELTPGAREVRFTLPGSLDEASPGLHGGSTFGTGPWRDALDADMLLMLADATALEVKAAGADARPMAPVDGRIESLLVAIQRWRSSGGRPVLHPVLVLSKFDAVSPKVLQAVALEPEPPSPGKARAREAYAHALLEPNLPRTFAMLRGPTGKKLRIAPPRYVFSRVRTQTDGAGAPVRIRLRQAESGGWEPEYSKDEYVAFLREIAEIASATKE